MKTVDTFRKRYELQDGWTFSVVRNQVSYGNSDGLYEVGLWNESKQLDTRVDGWLDMGDVLDLLMRAVKDPLKVYTNEVH